MFDKEEEGFKEYRPGRAASREMLAWQMCPESVYVLRAILTAYRLRFFYFFLAS